MDAVRGARRWKVTRLVFAWIVVLAGLAGAQGALMVAAGIIQWPALVGLTLQILTAIAAAGVLTWLTATWIGGRNERSWSNAMNRAASRRILR